MTARRWLWLSICVAAAPLHAFGAEIFAVGNCQHPTPDQRAAMIALDGSLTAEAAQKAAAEVQRRLSARLTDPAPPGPSSRSLTTTLEGWLSKRAWRAARARHEHDADEAATYCEFLLRETRSAP